MKRCILCGSELSMSELESVAHEECILIIEARMQDHKRMKRESVTIYNAGQEFRVLDNRRLS